MHFLFLTQGGYAYFVYEFSLFKCKGLMVFEAEQNAQFSNLICSKGQTTISILAKPA